MSTNPMNAMEIHGDRHFQPAAGVGAFLLLLARRRRRFFLDAGFEPTFLVFLVFLNFDSLAGAHGAVLAVHL